MEPFFGDGRMPVKDLDREESSNQEQQLQDPPKPCTPAHPTAGDSIINTVDAPVAPSQWRDLLYSTAPGREGMREPQDPISLFCTEPGQTGGDYSRKHR